MTQEDLYAVILNPFSNLWQIVRCSDKDFSIICSSLDRSSLKITKIFYDQYYTKEEAEKHCEDLRKNGWWGDTYEDKSGKSLTEGVTPDRFGR